jgi:two-component system response regulator NreC
VRAVRLAAHDFERGRGEDGLTTRARDVLRLAALGHTSREIADRLVLSVRTVEAHRARIQRRLGVSSRAELVRWALDNGLLTP